MKFVDNLRVSAKVALNSAGILILLRAASAATRYGLLAAQESFGQYRLLAHQTKSAAAVEADLLAARLAVQDFIRVGRSEEHTSELQSLMRISYAVFCLKKKKTDAS